MFWEVEEQEEEIPNLRRREQLVDTYEPYPTKFHLHLGEFMFTPIGIWWARGSHGNSSLVGA